MAQRQRDAIATARVASPIMIGRTRPSGTTKSSPPRECDFDFHESVSSGFRCGPQPRPRG